MEVKNYPLMTCSKEHGEDIVFFEFAKNLKVDIDVARELVANRLEFTSHRDHYIIIDVSNVKEVSIEAREYFQNPETGLKCIQGSAFIASNPLSALLANIFVKTPLNNTPSRYFSNEKDALNWIKELKRKANR